MASYFVVCHAPPSGEAGVHDRTRCPPECFPREAATEYVGEFGDPGQAVIVARLRYAHARSCAACEPPRAVTRVLPSMPVPTAPA
jgi:hypothetical protein